MYDIIAPFIGISFLILIPFLYYGIGRLFSRVSYTRKPALHRFGLRMIAMSLIFSKSLPDHCQMDCAVTECDIWTCPKYHFPKK